MYFGEGNPQRALMRIPSIVAFLVGVLIAYRSLKIIVLLVEAIFCVRVPRPLACSFHCFSSSHAKLKFF
ncbi:hypothetical protein [Mucilaginibacter kameinonensis]|uniref:hypothetical protein n=1 Tax=Mucilaginibacter kameinonensis TaxID=452286 RepID=UPI003744339C